MFRLRIVALGLLTAGLVFSTGSLSNGQDKKGKEKAKDKIVGARWEVTFYEGKMKADRNVFRADKLKIYKGAEQIGTYTEGKEEVKITIEKGKMAGTMDFKQIGKNPPSYAGKWTKPDGTEQKVALKLLVD